MCVGIGYRVCVSALLSFLVYFEQVRDCEFMVKDVECLITIVWKRFDCSLELILGGSAVESLHIS